MCFRPADAAASAGPIKCPECGKQIQAMGGVALKACPVCKADFSKYAGAPGAPAAPGAPGAPSVPGAPGMPSAPGVPSAPKAPGE